MNNNYIQMSNNELFAMMFSSIEDSRTIILYFDEYFSKYKQECSPDQEQIQLIPAQEQISVMLYVRWINDWPQIFQYFDETV